MNDASFLKLRRAIEIWGYILVCLVPLIFILKSLEFNGRGDDSWQYVLGYGAACIAAGKIFTEVTTNSKIVFGILLIPVALMLLGIATSFLR